MANTKISAMANASALTGIEQLAGVQGGVNVNITPNQIKTYIVSQAFTQTNTVTVANTAAETTLSGTGVGSLTIPANFFAAGAIMRLTAFGYHSATANPTIRIKVKFGATIVLDTGAVNSANSTNAGFELRAQVIGRTTGATGTVNAQGFYNEEGAGANIFGMVNTADTTIDTTATQAVTITAQWSAASSSNTISLPNLSMQTWAAP